MGLNLLSSHGLVLEFLARNPRSRIRDVASAVGLTERSVGKLIGDLERHGYVRRMRHGRRNQYEVVTAPPPRVTSGDGPCEAVVLACSDHRFQAALHALLSEQGLLGRAEVVLWPGGGPALAGPDRGELFHALAGVLERRGVFRLLLVSHGGCEVPEVPRPAGATAPSAFRSVRRWIRRLVVDCRRRLGIEPEIWVSDRRGAFRASFAEAGRVGARPAQVQEGASR